MKRYILDAKSSASWELEHGELVQAVNALPKGKAWKVEISQYREDRSARQNRALFGHLYSHLTEDTGYTAEELHEVFCRRFFGTAEHVVLDVRYEKAARTTTTNADGKRELIDTKTFAEFYSMIEDIAAQAGIHVPPPDPNWFRDK